MAHGTFNRNSGRASQKIKIEIPPSKKDDRFIIYEGSKKELFGGLNTERKLNDLLRILRSYNIISEQWDIPGKGYEERKYITNIKNQLASGATPKSVGYENDFILYLGKKCN